MKRDTHWLTIKLDKSDGHLLGFVWQGKKEARSREEMLKAVEEFNLKEDRPFDYKLLEDNPLFLALAELIDATKDERAAANLMGYIEQNLGEMSDALQSFRKDLEKVKELLKLKDESESSDEKH
jgi:hypothetical protein